MDRIGFMFYLFFSGYLILILFRPAYFMAILGTLTVLIFYVATKNMFDRKIAILSSILFATSPLLILNSRLPYHTSSIPLFVISLFYFTYKWIRGDVWIFPAITFMLGVLYNHEITTFVYSMVIGILLFYGFIKKEIWFKNLRNIKIIIASIIGFLIPMAPFIIYDIKTGEFNQTLRFLVWVGYRIVKFPLSILDPSFKSSGSSPSTINQFFIYYKDLIFSESAFIAVLIFVISVLFTIFYFHKHIKPGSKKLIKIKEKIPVSYMLLFLFLFTTLLGLSTHRVPIEADTLLIAPFVILLTVLSILWLFRNKFLPGLLVILLIAVINIYALLSTNFFTLVNGEKALTYQDKLKASEKVIELTNGKDYNLEVKGVLDNFKSFSTPYEYLLWWKGDPPSKSKQNLKVIIWEKDNNIDVYKENE